MSERGQKRTLETYVHNVRFTPNSGHRNKSSDYRALNSKTAQSVPLKAEMITASQRLSKRLTGTKKIRGQHCAGLFIMEN